MGPSSCRQPSGFEACPSCSPPRVQSLATPELRRFTENRTSNPINSMSRSVGSSSPGIATSDNSPLCQTGPHGRECPRPAGVESLINNAEVACAAEDEVLAEIEVHRVTIEAAGRTFTLMRGVQMGTATEAELLEEMLRQAGEE